MNEQKLEVLEQTSLPRILVYLKKKGKASRTDLRNNIHASQGAIYNALRLLVENNLIEENMPSGYERRKEVNLTEKGNKVVSILEKLEGLL